ncbi:hypothetical protein VPH35_051372 [Triticum aestivum]
MPLAPAPPLPRCFLFPFKRRRHHRRTALHPRHLRLDPLLSLSLGIAPRHLRLRQPGRGIPRVELRSCRSRSEPWRRSSREHCWHRASRRRALLKSAQQCLPSSSLVP